MPKTARGMRFNTPSDEEHSENFEPRMIQKVPHIELVRKRIEEANLQPRMEMEFCGLKTSDSSLSKEIPSHRSRKSSQC